ncbi:hypothetical protein R5R35_014689 [Gryllus longicercus]|uniref:Retrovirus-related Pol polyprotein from transposon TNT 1-94 n=1 Tax=Gryllus longicercus TaxID=2509291 RepID=A0AAN9Z0I1_9ORTH
MAASECDKEAVYLQKFVRELGFKDLAEIVIYCDNKSALSLAENPTFHNRSKHIAIRHHFVRDLLKNKILSLKYVSTENQIADFLTKGLTKKKHQWCTEKTGLKSIDC